MTAAVGIPFIYHVTRAVFDNKVCAFYLFGIGYFFLGYCDICSGSVTYGKSISACPGIAYCGILGVQLIRRGGNSSVNHLAALVDNEYHL